MYRTSIEEGVESILQIKEDRKMKSKRIKGRNTDNKVT